MEAAALHFKKLKIVFLLTLSKTVFIFFRNKSPVNRGIEKYIIFRILECDVAKSSFFETDKDKFFKLISKNEV